ncbi:MULTISPECIES: DUF6461 domain-containing protein [Streptosporangium]|uniref:Uncharacterized protein n=1 Tax=Streptosporangium brasiliense TaxID=47480 RepID=A0ABT9RAY9_9ACTN|nr:DUF6461 domain-containing protein [Streptosporangium brasiliense]MDP9866398.1 hypothetical protein [Streptosporangium brasiliense]
MADTHEEFGWLAKHGPFCHVSCITFARSFSPREALMRLGADSSGIEEVTFEKHQERTMEYIDSDNMRTSYVGALEMKGWTVLIQLWTGSIGLNRLLLRSLSRSTEVVSIHRNVHATDYFVYAIDGEQVTCFDQLVPDTRWGSDPDRLVSKMREVGLSWEGPGVGAPFPRPSFPRSFTLAKKITGFSFSEDILNTRFLGAAVRDR